MMIRFMVTIGLALLATSVTAQQREEPVGCDAFKWSLEGERALLLAPPEASVESGASIQPPVGKAVTIRLKPVAAAGLPIAPERPQRAQDGKAGFVRIEAPARAGPYRITLAQAGWIDVIQNGRPLRAGAFSGATGCKGVRKSVTFELEAAPFMIQISGVPADSIGLIMTPGTPETFPRGGFAIPTPSDIDERSKAGALSALYGHRNGGSGTSFMIQLAARAAENRHDQTKIHPWVYSELRGRRAVARLAAFRCAGQDADRLRCSLDEECIG